MNFYMVPTRSGEELELRQGDILEPVPFFAFSIKEADVLPPGADAPNRVNLAAAENLQPGTILLASVQTSIGIVLNQSCDLTGQPGREKPILVARVVPCTERIKGFNSSSIKHVVDHIKALANPGRTPSLFYLPEWHNNQFSMSKSVVDLLETVCLPPSELPTLRELIRLRLSEPALQAFQERLAYCFGRFGTPDELYFNDAERRFVSEQQKSKRRED